MPSSTVLFGFATSHATVKVEGTDWLEPVLLWISICMPTGSGKSSLCKFIKGLISSVYTNRAKGTTPSWFLDDQSLEKMGSIMQENNGKILALYDELSMFLSQMNVFSGKKITDSHELSVFLQLYGAHSWVRKIGKHSHWYTWYFKIPQSWHFAQYALLLLLPENYSELPITYVYMYYDMCSEWRSKF